MNEFFWLLKFVVEVFKQNDWIFQIVIVHLWINGGNWMIVDWNDWKFWSVDLVIEIFWLPNLMTKKLGTQKISITNLI